jgi:4-amino-4-deoxy-L-arabinose transferase-like glycosyltransferase
MLLHLTAFLLATALFLLSSYSFTTATIGAAIYVIVAITGGLTGKWDDRMAQYWTTSCMWIILFVFETLTVTLWEIVLAENLMFLAGYAVLCYSSVQIEDTGKVWGEER